MTTKLTDEDHRLLMTLNEASKPNAIGEALYTLLVACAHASPTASHLRVARFMFTNHSPCGDPKAWRYDLVLDHLRTMLDELVAEAEKREEKQAVQLAAEGAR